MTKTMLITGATDGIGLETAKALVSAGHKVLIHGRNTAKLQQVNLELSTLNPKTRIETYQADLSDLNAVSQFADQLLSEQQSLDVIINNAGVYKTPETITPVGLDIRFVVNTLAPYLLTQRLLPLLPADGRVINLSSAAQAPVDMAALKGKKDLANDSQAYAQSKLAITMWSIHLANTTGKDAPSIIAVNPGSLLASKMVRDAYGIEGKDLSVGSDILVRAALSEEFAHASGQYFDNDSQQFTQPHADAVNLSKQLELIQCMDMLLLKLLNP